MGDGAAVAGDAAAPRAESCGRHPGAAAGWRCGACRVALCPDCTASLKAGSKAFAVCAGCGAEVERIARHRTAMPYALRVREAPRFPLSPLGRATWLILAGFVAALSYVFSLAFFAVGTFWAYLFYVIRATGSGARQLLAPDFTEIGADLIMPTLKGVLATALVWAPAVGYAIAVRGWHVEELPWGQVLRDPAIWALVLAGTAYVPAALLAAATHVSLAGMLNPFRVLRQIRRLGPDYFTAVKWVGALVIVDVLVDSFLCPLLAALPVPFVSRWAAEAASLYAPLVIARVLGLLLYVRGDAIGWGEPGDYVDPVLPGAEPRGAMPAAGARRPVAPDATATVVPPSADHDLAALPPAEQLALGQTAARRRDFALAVRALKPAAFSADPVAPKAMLMLAQVYSDGLGDAESAARLYDEALRRYPGTDAAAFARRKRDLLGAP